MWAIEDAKPEDWKALMARDLRKLDVDEWEGGLGQPAIYSFIKACLDPDCKVLRVLMYKGQQVAIWGVTATPEPGIGSLWMMGTEFSPDETFDTAMGWFNLWEGEMALLHARGAETLMALADDRNRSHHAWLKTMGFKALPEKAWGATWEGEPIPYTNWVRRQH